MNRFNQINFLLCGIALMLAAFPVFAQEDNSAARATEINKKTLRDLGELIRQKIEQKEIDFDKPFLVEVEAVLTEEGRFDLKKSKVTKTEGDAEMVEIAKSAILAISDAGFLGYLKNQGVDKVLISMQQDDSKFSSVIKLGQQTVERAKTLASGLSLLISYAKKASENGSLKIDENSKLLVNNSKISSEEKSVIINFSMPKLEFHEMILREIMKSTEKNKNVQS